MTLLPHAPQNKIPGSTVTLPLAKEENRIKDLTKLTRLELLDLKEREGKLLSNKARLSRLPDKGKRIEEFYAKVIAELDRRANLDEAAALFSELNIIEKGENALNNMEWTGQFNGLISDSNEGYTVDSDDEAEEDPLRILARGNMHERLVKVMKPEPTLITEADLRDIEELKAQQAAIRNETNVAVAAEIVEIDVGAKLRKLQPQLQNFLSTSNTSLSSSTTDKTESSTLSTLPDLEQHVRYVVSKTETETHPHKEKFKPYKTTKSNVHDPCKERERKKGKHWEVTAATPPPIQHNGAKMLSLLDSVEIQANYLAKLKELHERQAEDRLMAKMQRLESCKIVLPNAEALKNRTIFTEYRQPVRNQIEGSPNENEMNEVYDPHSEEPFSSGVGYPVLE